MATCLTTAACGGGKKSTGTGAAPSASPSAAAGAKPSTEIKMVDYGYVISGPATKGGTMRLTNAGQELHMMFAGKLKEGKKAADVLAALQIEDPDAADKAMGDVVDEVASPSQGLFGGGSVDVGVDLEPGTYALMCFVPTADEGVPHALKGMLNELAVVDGTASAPKADATYTVEAGKPIQGPAELKKGYHVIEIDGKTGAEELNPTLAKLKEGKGFSDLVKDVDAMFTSEDPPKKGYLQAWPGTLNFSLGDLGDPKKLVVGVDLEPGTYVLAVFDTDQEKTPTDPPEQITIKVS